MDRLAPSSVYKLLLGQLIGTDLYYRLYSGYAALRFYYVTSNIDRVKLRLLYELRLVPAYYGRTRKRP